MNPCAEADVFAQPELGFEDGGAAMVTAWLVDTYDQQSDLLLDADRTCTPAGDWPTADCAAVAACYAAAGLALPDAYPPLTEDPIDTSCGPIAVHVVPDRD